MAMPFSGKEKEKEKMATANWQSEHYLAFTRLSLVHLGPLETISKSLTEDKALLFKAFRAMRIFWFCVMSHTFSDTKVPSRVIDNYIRLFLSSCNRLHDLFPKKRDKKSNKVNDDEQKQEMDEEQDDEQEQDGNIFSISGVNFLNLLSF